MNITTGVVQEIPERQHGAAKYPWRMWRLQLRADPTSAIEVDFPTREDALRFRKSGPENPVRRDLAFAQRGTKVYITRKSSMAAVRQIAVAGSCK